MIKGRTVYELKFVSELTHEHFLQCACYVVAKKLKKGILWNTRTNDMYEISIPMSFWMQLQKQLQSIN